MIEIPPIALTLPRLISRYSAWIPHIPFGFTLIDLLRPKTVVELGTHNGDSYCAFCQAIQLLNLPTTCTAIDTWAGDPDAGQYTQSVLEKLRQHHDPLYSNFSTLLQSTFQAAAKDFRKNSIDLLHIDGSHDYASVKNDFETYLPLLSNNAVVLFHDTQVTTENFGVYQLWKELTPQYPHFEFIHAYGLGILAVGLQIPEPLLQFFHDANNNPAQTRNTFSALGDRLELARILANLSEQLQLQLTATNRWRSKHNIPSLPDFPFPTTAFEILAAAPDPKSLHDRFVWYATSISGDFNHITQLAPRP